MKHNMWGCRKCLLTCLRLSARSLNGMRMTAQSKNPEKSGLSSNM